MYCYDFVFKRDPVSNRVTLILFIEFSNYFRDQCSFMCWYFSWRLIGLEFDRIEFYIELFDLKFGYRFILIEYLYKKTKIDCMIKCIIFNGL
jgi:hypothetical protein